MAVRPTQGENQELVEMKPSCPPEAICPVPLRQDVRALPEHLRPKHLAKNPMKGAYGCLSWTGLSSTITTVQNLGGRQGEVVHMDQDR